MKFKELTAPLVGTGALIATYLLLRPYGDAAGATTLQAAEAFGSWRWVAAHLAGMLGIASIGRLAARLHLAIPSTLSRAARTFALGGAVLVLPYYGAETFALHVIGKQALTSGDASVLSLVEPIRSDAVAMTTFGIGLLMLAVAGILMALAWQRAKDRSAWPLGVMVALLLPQFYLPTVGRMGFGILTTVAAAIWLISATRVPADREVAIKHGEYTGS